MSVLSYSLPASTAPALPDLEGVEGAITDHADRAVNRLAEQYKKPKIEAFLRALVHPLQSIETVAFQVYTERNVDTAIGAQLDILGRIVGQERGGYGDDAYRRLIRARIAVNRSDGTLEELLTIARLIIDDEDVVVVAEPQYPATIVLKATEAAITAETAGIALDFLQEAAAGGVRVMFEYFTIAPVFSFANGPGLGFGDGAFASVGS